MKLIGEFGLKNKREVWRMQLTLARIRKAARVLLTLDDKDPRRMFEGGALLRCAPPGTYPLRSRSLPSPASSPRTCLQLATGGCCAWACWTRRSSSWIMCWR